MENRVCMELVKAFAACGHEPYELDKDDTLHCIGSRCAHWRVRMAGFRRVATGYCGLSGPQASFEATPDPAKEA